MEYESNHIYQLDIINQIYTPVKKKHYYQTRIYRPEFYSRSIFYLGIINPHSCMPKMYEMTKVIK